MNSAFFIELIHNTTLLFGMVLIYDVLVLRRQTNQRLIWKIVTGVSLGLIGVVLMLTHWELAPGIIFDSRSILISVTGLFFGTIPTLIVMAITTGVRISQGGYWWTGVSVILVTGAIGLAWHHLRFHRPGDPRHVLEQLSLGEAYLFGLVNHICLLLLLLVTLPRDFGQQVVAEIGGLVVLIYPLGSTMLTMLLVNRLRREQVSQALVESEARLRLAVSAANVGFFVHDLKTDQEHYSAEWKNQLGFGEDEALDPMNEWKDRLHPEDRQRVLSSQRDYLEGREPKYEATFRLRHKDGSYRWILSRAILQNEPSQKPATLLGCHIDITRQKQFETEIVTSERRFRGLAESSQDYIMLYDRNCRHVYMNPAGLRVGGHTETDIIGKTHREAGFSEELSELWEKDIQTVFNSGVSAQRLFEWQSVAGPAFLDWRLSPVFDEKSSVEWVLGVSRDITALKQAELALKKSEEQYRMLTESMKDVVWVSDAETLNFRYVSPSVTRLRGFTPEEIMAEPMDAALTPEGRQFVRNLIHGRESDFLSGKVPADQYYTEEVEQPCKDGSTVWTEAVTHFFRNQESGRIEILGVTRDVNARKQAEEKVQAAQDELKRLLAEADTARRVLLSVAEDQRRAEEEVRKLNAELEKRVYERTAQLVTANQELEAFAYSVSHDLRAPLRAMDGFSAALLQSYSDVLDEQGRHYLSRIQEASRRMGQLISDLLSLSRVTRAELIQQRVNLSQLALDISKELQGQDPQREVTFEIQPDLIVQADLRLLKIALENLLANSYKFTSRCEHAEIQVGLKTEGKEGIYYVRDNGVGFDMAYASNLFAPFHRLHGMLEFPGTGIGLVTVQRIIHRHGGRIWPEAELNRGATFYFTLGGI